MATAQHSNKATKFAPVIAANKVLLNNTVVRMQQRIAAVQATRKQHHATRIAAREQAAAALANAQAYHTALAQLQAQYGVQATSAPKARANSATAVPSAALITFNGAQYTPCKAVHAIAAHCNGVRKATLALCKQVGINPATASTQFGIYRKQHAN